MDTNAGLKLVDLLEQLSSDYPSQTEWQELADRVREDLDLIEEMPTETRRASRAPSVSPDELCFVCAITPAAGESSMCPDCAAMYRTVSARVVPGTCDCGHPAEDRRVYVYRKGRNEQTLCGRSCVGVHFRKIFAPFLGNSA